MRIAFCGSGEFAVTTLCELVADKHDIVLVFTNPDRPSGRGKHTHFTPVKDKAIELGLPLTQPENLRDGTALELLEKAAPDLVVVVAYGHLIPAKMLNLPAHGFINLHASLLPKYRGAAPVPHAILNGEAETGVTVFRLNERFDEGAILAREAIPILPDDTSQSVLEKLAPIGARLVRTVVGEIVAGWVSPEEQAESESCRAPKLDKSMGQIDWSWPAEKISCMVRAFQPWPLAYTFCGEGKKRSRLVVLGVEYADAECAVSKPGQVIRADGKLGLAIKCGKGALWLREVKPEGKRAMQGREFMRGHRIEAGVLLG